MSMFCLSSPIPICYLIAGTRRNTKTKGVLTGGFRVLFETSIDLLTEVCRRLDRCGVKEGNAGDLLWHDVVQQFSNSYMAVEPDLHNIHGYFRLRPSAVLALDYCCGRDAKDENFYHWKNRKKTKQHQLIAAMTRPVCSKCPLAAMKVGRLVKP